MRITRSAARRHRSASKLPPSPALQVVVHFWAAWCEPCKFLDEVLRQLATDAPSVAVLRVEAEEAAEISEAQGVSVVPAFGFYASGRRVDWLEGADAAALTAKFNALAVGGSAGAAVVAAAQQQQQQQQQADSTALHARLAALVKQRPVMLFMKGSPDAPR